ncbi:RNA polymerase sigma factor [Sphaerisporangium corydalis]|uniref:RNA polymerase sigma factor n=1 Tax=Sphaerisporangium corydalis TaxID=1441875 RepID=A0ABV9EID9_9ACTN|nr:sigma-70 family RNA polymerase sigma factor [Sphaerisporangium corydalis]
MPYDLDLPDETAWRELVERFGYRMWAVARAFGLGPADAADAVQAAWLRLVESLPSIRDPERVGAWLVTTTRHEAARIGRRRAGAPLTGLPADIPAMDGDPAAALLSEDEGRRLWAAVDTLREPCRSLLRLIVTAPEAGYAQLARRLGMPIGSIGPTRIRCLRRLRTLLEDDHRRNDDP